MISIASILFIPIYWKFITKSIMVIISVMFVVLLQIRNGTLLWLYLLFPSIRRISSSSDKLLICALYFQKVKGVDKPFHLACFVQNYFTSFIALFSSESAICRSFSCILEHQKYLCLKSTLLFL